MLRWRVHLMAIGAIGLLLGSTGWGEAADFRGKVSRVIDGDTVEVRHDGRTERIQLRGIDCPELKQPYGKQAKRAVRAMVSGVTVGVRTYGRDKRGRVMADLVIDRGRSVAYILLEEGLAWRITSGAHDEALEAAEAEARYAKRGLWSDPNAVAPWVYRASKSRKR